MTMKLKDDPELVEFVRGSLWTKNRERLEVWLLNRDNDEGIHPEARIALALEHIACSLNDVAVEMYGLKQQLQAANHRESPLHRYAEEMGQPQDITIDDMYVCMGMIMEEKDFPNEVLLHRLTQEQRSEITGWCLGVHTAANYETEDEDTEPAPKFFRDMLPDGAYYKTWREEDE